MKADISVCLIVKNEEKNLESCLLSFKDYVKEIVVVDTGSTDSSLDIARKYTNIVESYSECNDENGIIANFSKARNRSLELATNDVCMWIDADDELKNPELLYELVESHKNESCYQILLPYEYAYDENGNVLCFHYRERIVYPKSKFKWVNPVHEVLLAQCDTNSIVTDTIKVVHRRSQAGKVTDPYRNFNIIKKFVDEIGDSDPRQLYYLGLEYGNIGKFEEAIEVLSRYINLSGWDDERCLAALKVAEHYIQLNKIDDSIIWANKAIHIKSNWSEPYFHLGKLYYNLAILDDKLKKPSYKNWENACNFIKIGLGMPPTKTLLFVNPRERDLDIHRFFNFALSKIGDIESALQSVNTALSKFPEDKELRLNKTVYENYLNRANIIRAVDLLDLDSSKKESIINMLSGNVEAIKNHENQSVNNAEHNTVSFKEYHRPQGYPKNVTQEDFPVAVKTPHSQAWGIPEQTVYDDLPLQMTDEQLKSITLTIWKEYMLHDEIASAILFLENCPYRLRHSDFVQTLLLKTNKFIEWTKSNDSYDRGNAAIDGNNNLLGREMIPLEYDLTGPAKMRFQWMNDRMPDKSNKLLDLACIDGEFSNRYALQGYDVTGVDCCSYSIAIANEAAMRHNTKAKHILSYFSDMPNKINERYDYITCGDVYEHLLDPSKDLLTPAREMVKDDGKMLLVTPHGAWFRGKFCNHAHPWLWANENAHWLSEKDRAHVIAPTVWSVVDNFRKSGWYVKDCVVVGQWYPDVEGQGNVCVEALPQRKNNKNKSVVFYIGDGWETWTPHTVNITGIGGSETAAIEMAKNLVGLGYDVKVYSSCGKYGEGVYDGVEYYETEKFHDIKCDILIVSRYADALRESLNVVSDKKYLWVHDVVPYNLTKECYNKLDGIFALSNWHKENIIDKINFVESDKVIVTSNGINLLRFDKDVKRDPYKVVVSSSPDRYLPSLLQMWDRIKERVPQATLHICYGFENWSKIASVQNDSNLLKLISGIKNEVNLRENDGIYYKGRLNQNRLADEMLSAGAMLYSTWFTETSCITALEAQAAGMAIVTSPIAALKETAKNATFIEGDWLSEEYHEAFIEAAVNVLQNTSESERLENKKFAAKFEWKKVAESWSNLFEGKNPESKKVKSNVPKLKEYVPIYEVA